MKKQAFLQFLMFVQQNLDSHHINDITDGVSNKESGVHDFSSLVSKGGCSGGQHVVNNMLQISDFFQCKAALNYCIEQLHITKEGAFLNIREALKKIQGLQLLGK